MAKDALLQTLGVINAGTAGMTTGSTYTSAPLSLEPFGSNGINSLFMRWMIAQPTYNNLPAATTTSAFQFGFEVSKDGSTWTSAYQSPTDIQSFKTHIVNTFSAPIQPATGLTILYPTVTSTATITSGSSSITAAPLCSIGDALYFTTAIAPFATSTPYYVVSMTPTGTTTATIQLASTPGGVPITATASNTSVLTKYLTNQVNYAVNDVVYWTGTAAAGTNAPTAAADTQVPPVITGGGNIQRFYVTSVAPSSFTGVIINISNTPGGAAFASTAAVSSGVSFLVQPNLAGGEFYAPVGVVSGFIDQYGAVQDVYKYIRGWLKVTIPNTIAPIALVRCDLVPSRDGAYS